jgi:ABC-2 type transport system permease protein
MSKVLTIALNEGRALWRNRTAIISAGLFLALSLMAILNAWDQFRFSRDLRATYQSEANATFDAQPDRHPHRMVHYGHFVFRPLNPLAAFDPGVDAFTGHMLYLEGHRQNSANFSETRQNTSLVRFGQLTPAFCLQVLAPLLLIFLGFGLIARERESGTLALSLTQGVSGTQLVLGKALCIAAVAAVILLPALITVCWLGAAAGQGMALTAAILAGYVLYLMSWAGLILLVSMHVPRAREALLTLVAAWTCLCVFVPRITPDIAAQAHPLLTQMETDIRIHKELKAMGDSHNPDDPYFSGFKQKVLRTYGVTRIEDLPVNYKGLLAVEGEKMTSDLFKTYAARNFGQQQAQTRLMDGAGWLSPLLALQRVSMTGSGTDLAAYQAFLDQGEAYRYGLVQHLNQLQATTLTYVDDTDKMRENRIDHRHWTAYPDFRYRPPAESERLRRLLPSLGVLAIWFAAVLALSQWSVLRLGRAAQ